MRKSRTALVPASAQVPEILSTLDHGSRAIHAFEAACGGREVFIEALAPSASGHIKDLIEALQDPNYKSKSLGWLCEHVGVSLTDLMRSFRTGLLTRAHILSTRALAEKIPAIVDDILAKSVTTEYECAICEGAGTLAGKKGEKRETCTECRGKGKVIREADFERQRLALELAELIKQKGGGGFTVMQQFNNGLPGGSFSSTDTRTGTLEKMQQAVSKVLYDRGTVIDITPEG